MTTPTMIDDFWEAYGNSDLLVEVTAEGPTGSLAADVLDTFGLNADSTASSLGGNLYGLDIKHMDAMAVINLSLLEALAESGSFSNGTMYEPIVNADGDVEIIEVGQSTASLSDIYYQIQAATYVEECKGVLIRGGQVLPTWVDSEWKLIWENSSAGKLVFDTTKMVSNCSLDNFSTHALVVFNDPNLENNENNDGINNLYELTDDPFKKILGYATYIGAEGDVMTDETRVTYNNTAIVPIQVSASSSDSVDDPSVGTLVAPPSLDAESESYGTDCWSNNGERVPYTYGVEIPLNEELRYESVRGTTVDKFQKVEDIYIVAKKLTYLAGAPYGNDEAAAASTPDESNCRAVISIESSTYDTIKLRQGKDYVISYKEDDSGSATFKVPYVVFSKHARVNEVMSFGEDTPYIICQDGLSGYYNQGETGTGTILPAAENRGYLVHEVWALVSIDTPSIAIYDPPNVNASYEEESPASAIAENLKYYVKPLMVYEPPASIAFNGEILDQAEGIQDHDPTTVQDFSATPLEQAMDTMDGGGGIELTLPFFNDPDTDDEKLANLSQNLYNFMNNGTGIETTYVCGPTTQVELGEVGPSGGIINNITYSYTDSGSYTISVNEGPRLVKPLSGGGPSGPSMKASESFNARGTIIQALGNGIHFKVRIDGFGERIAINMSKEILREGDIVSCSVHNNPVEA